MTQKILCIDDEPNILEAYQRHLRKQFQIETALGGESGLAALTRQGPYAVVVSDLRMPGMNGIEFLARVKACSPDSVRVMLTGQADLNDAIAAINDGNIFRFLTKPCPPELLTKTLQAALEQYRLITVEQELLEKTLSGSIKVLTEILSLVKPTAFSRTYHIRQYVQHMATQLGLPDIWQFDLAAMLSQIGCITVPPNTLDKVYAGQRLSEDERGIFAAHPAIGRSLLAKIPRLESIAQMIEGQQKPYKEHKAADPQNPDIIALGAQMLKVAIDFDRALDRGLARAFVLTRMREQPEVYDPALVAALATIDGDTEDKEIQTISVHELKTHMVLDENVRAKNGLLLLARGQAVTETVIQRLRNFARVIGVTEPLRVRVMRPAPPKETPKIG